MTKTWKFPSKIPFFLQEIFWYLLSCFPARKMCHSTWKVTATTFSVFNFLKILLDVGWHLLQNVWKWTCILHFFPYFLLHPLQQCLRQPFTLFVKPLNALCYVPLSGNCTNFYAFLKKAFLKLMFLHRIWDRAKKEAFLMWNSLTFFVISHRQSELHFGLFGHRTNCLHGIWPSTLLDCRLFGKLPVFCRTHLRRSFF